MTTEKLDPEFKAKWIAALRSGEYKQAKSTIYDKHEHSFCCIGVAAVVNGHDCKSDEFNGVGYLDLPAPIAGGFRNNTTIQLMNMNDSGSSFIEIADWIDANL